MIAYSLLYQYAQYMNVLVYRSLQQYEGAFAIH